MTANAKLQTTSSNTVYPNVIVTDTRRLIKGSPWIYSNELNMGTEAKALDRGAMVRLMDNKGNFLAIASFNAHSLIAARIYSRLDITLSVDWFKARLEEALARRAAFINQNCYRLVHSEADTLPGFIIDRYNDKVVVQLNTAGAEQLSSLMLEALQGVLPGVKAIVKRDQAIREREGIALIKDLEADNDAQHAATDASHLAQGIEGNIQFEADILHGQKTGWFYDQRDNRALLQSISKGKTVLDAYCFTGAFGLNAKKGGATRVVCLDSSARALEIAAQNAKLNNLSIETLCDNAFIALPKLAASSFDIVVIDPPAFVKSKKDLNAGIKGYKKLVQMAQRLVKPQGYLLFTSCSYHVDLHQLQIILAEGLGTRFGSILKTLSAGIDHPEHPHLPETGYLKGFLVQLA